MAAGPGFFALLRRHWADPEVIAGLFLVGYSVLLVAEVHLAYLAAAIFFLAARERNGGFFALIDPRRCLRRPATPATRFASLVALFFAWMCLTTLFHLPALATQADAILLARTLLGMGALWIVLCFFLHPGWHRRQRLGLALDCYVAATACALGISLLVYFFVPQSIYRLQLQRLSNLLVYWGGLAPVLTGMLAGFAALVLACRWSRWRERRVWACLMLVILTAACLYSHSRGPMLASALSLLLLFVLRPRPSLAPLLIVAAVVAVYQYASPKRTIYMVHDAGDRPPLQRLVKRKDGGRLPLYRALRERMEKRDWIVGKGLGKDHVVTRPEIRWHAHHPHGGYISTVYHGGGIGLLLVLAAAGYGWWQGFRVYLRERDPTWFCLAACGGLAFVVDGESFASMWTLPRLEALMFWFPLAAGVARQSFLERGEINEAS